MAAGLNWSQRLHLGRWGALLHCSAVLRPGSPLERQEGEYRTYSRCHMYNVTDWAAVLSEHGGEWPEEPQQDWQVVPCQHGWNYDKTEYRDTLVTLVLVLQCGPALAWGR